MEKLTIRNSDGSVSQPADLNWAEALEKLARYEDTGLEPDIIKNCFLTQKLIDTGCTPVGVGSPLKHLFELAQAEAEGRLVMLPCKVGDTIYILGGDVKNGYETVKKTHVEEVPFGLGCLNKQMKLYPFYYLSREEAEKALEGMNNG